ncbi:MAG TPA: hypothetical protein VG733_10450, partial [Chthoniobacteraceae bacterium]|nr:hypothetical protein [Chthoniobacteraceae bacterium]
MEPHILKTAIRCLLLCATLSLLAACETTEQKEVDAQRKVMNDAIAAEQPGDYYVGRRFYKVDYKFWGFVRSPGKPWSTAKLVMLNEQKTLAPDRNINQIGYDNGYEYKLLGYFSGELVYEPASNGFYPEFVLTGYERLNSTPAPLVQ